MKSIEIILIVLILAGFSITEFHTFIYYQYPFTSTLKYDGWWYDKSYVQSLTPQYYLYEVEPLIQQIVWCLSVSVMGHYGFKRIRNVFIVFTLYYLTELCFYILNRNTSLFSNSIVYLYMALAFLSFFIPTKKVGKLVSLEDY